MSETTLFDLAATIRSRRASDAEKSYTKSLLEGGPERCAKKFGEEAVEAIIAATSQSEAALRSEAADVLFHLLVLLESRGVAIGEVLTILDGRMGVSGHVEKASRPAGSAAQD